MRVLVTGAAGFIGHHVAHRLQGHNLTFLDRLDSSGNLNRLAEMGINGRFIYHDLKSPVNDQLVRQIGPQDWIIHMAASTHVDRSIDEPLLFVMDNVVGTCNALELARKINAKFLYFSTDEIFGSAPPGVAYKEDDRYRSTNPYSASKAGGEELVIAYENTYKLHTVVTHTMNVFGERQHPEKFVPLLINKISAGETVVIHSDETKTIAGSRFYIYAPAVASAVEFLLENGESGQKYNIVGEEEVDNLTLAQMVADILGKPLKYEMSDWHSLRPGHDQRYALDGGKMKSMGWVPPDTLQESLKKTVAWYLENPQWR